MSFYLVSVINLRMSKNLLIVESPAKAKTIAKYLGSDFVVKSSVGHIRQIPKKGTQVDVENGFETNYEVEPDKKKVVSELKTASKNKEVWLATDPDREGEAIAWHLQQVLGLSKDVKRVTYHEITKNAVEEAVKSPRGIDMDLVAAQQARQILDRIVGYELSPVVWRKVPGGKSAGRVQSPALRLVVERERSIAEFASDFSFKISGIFAKDKEEIKAVSPEVPKSEPEAEKALNSLIGAEFSVGDVVNSPGKRSPSAPFTTSTLQQTANSKFGWGAKTTMSTAQRLYQAGLITYMRTDSVNLSGQFLSAATNYIKSTFGEKYHQFRTYASKNSSAQEAHEAIRPTDVSKEVAGGSDMEQKLYELIRARALASQMAPAVIEKTVVQILNDKSPLVFEAKGEVVVFDGFLKVYGGGKDEILPNLSTGDKLNAKEIIARQTFSRPPARYTEGSLIKELENRGIGRPSTYASIIDNIQTRGYVLKGVNDGEERDVIQLSLRDDKVDKNTITEKSGANKGKLVPTDVGKVLSDFLVKYFDHVVDYDWTARIEGRLDQIAEGKMNKVEMLGSFYKPFHAEIEKSGDIERSEIAGSRELGKDPKSGRNIYARVARFGAVLQIGESGKDVEEKPEFIPLDGKFSIETITLDQAIEQINAPRLPRNIGKTTEGVEIIAAKGPFGNYLKCGDINVTLPKDSDPFKITMQEAEKLYREKLDSIIADWGDIKILKGKYGPYVKGPGRWNNVRIPKETNPTKITEVEARKMLDEKPKKSTKRRVSRRKKK